MVFVERFGFDSLVPSAEEESEGAADSGTPEEVRGSGCVAAEGESNPKAEEGHRGEGEACGLLWDDDEFVPVPRFQEMLEVIVSHAGCIADEGGEGERGSYSFVSNRPR